MKTQLLSALIAGACAFVALPAHALLLSPATVPVWTTNVTSNFGSGNPNDPMSGWAGIEAAFGIDVDGTGTLYYKANVGGTDEGPFASRYSTTFSDEPNDPSAALIEFLGGASIDCPACFLLVKDGNQTPAQYLFDISSWNGTDDIELSGFWPNQGAISNIAIWGFEEGDDNPGGNVPEPGSLALLGLGLAGLAALRRRRH